MIPKNKTRDVNKPYAVYIAGDWEFRVLKHYQKPENEETNPYARVLTAVKSPMTWGSYDMGDSYLMEIQQCAQLVYTHVDGAPPILKAGTGYTLTNW